jgi:1-acyl-sn-glycerol-3-phosphate acyltransferase
MKNPDRPGTEFGRGGPSVFDTIRALVWLVFLIAAAVVLLPAQMIAHGLGLSARRTIPILFHRIVLRALGARITVRGEPTSHRPALFVPNHVSWMDIMVLGAFAPVSFVAKSEIATWPLFGYLARLQRSIFVDRERRHTTSRTADEMIARMREGEPVVLFAEGTSSDGNRVLRFRPALVGAAETLARATGEIVWIQPIALAYRRINGLPAGRQHRPPRLLGRRHRAGAARLGAAEGRRGGRRPHLRQPRALRSERRPQGYRPFPRAARPRPACLRPDRQGRQPAPARRSLKTAGPAQPRPSWVIIASRRSEGIAITSGSAVQTSQASTGLPGAMAASRAR